MILDYTNLPIAYHTILLNVLINSLNASHTCSDVHILWYQTFNQAIVSTSDDWSKVIIFHIDDDVSLASLWWISKINSCDCGLEISVSNRTNWGEENNNDNK